MRLYQNEIKNDKKTVKIVCNQCGKEIEVVDGVAGEEVLSVEKRWGYFSGKDNERHAFDLCEDCYDKLTAGFRIPVEINEP